MFMNQHNDICFLHYLITHVITNTRFSHNFSFDLTKSGPKKGIYESSIDK